MGSLPLSIYLWCGIDKAGLEAFVQLGVEICIAVLKTGFSWIQNRLWVVKKYLIYVAGLEASVQQGVKLSIAAIKHKFTANLQKIIN